MRHAVKDPERVFEVNVLKTQTSIASHITVTLERTSVSNFLAGDFADTIQLTCRFAVPLVSRFRCAKL
jgi:hypothetical protein